MRLKASIGVSGNDISRDAKATTIEATIIAVILIFFLN
jgi:hypothetical protein